MDSFQEFNYRRGLVLGFTTAELTVLLLFLLLLIMGSSFYGSAESESNTPAKDAIDKIETEFKETEPSEVPIEQFEEQKMRIQNIQSELEAKQQRTEALNAESDTAFDRSKQFLSSIEQQQSEINVQQEEQEKQIQDIQSELEAEKRRIEVLTAELNTAIDRNERYRSLIQQQQSNFHDLREEKDELERKVNEVQNFENANLELENKLREFQTEINRLLSEREIQAEKMLAQLNQLEELRSNHMNSESDAKQLQMEFDEEQRETQRLQREIDLLVSDSNKLKETNRLLDESNLMLQRQVTSLSNSESKGTESACWFRVQSNDDGSKEEKALYLFDISITDDHVVVHYPSKSRNGSATDSNFSRSQLNEIFHQIGFDQTEIGNPMNFNRFIQVFGSFKAAGHRKKIRVGQQCTFHVALWDHTSKSNKEGYQMAKEQTVDQVFISYRYRDDVWPHG